MLSVSSTIKELYMRYVPLAVIGEKVGMSEDDVVILIKPYIETRAKLSLAAVDLTLVANEPPIIKLLVTKLSVLRAELFRRASLTLSLEELTRAESVDNAIKKLQINGNNEWLEQEEIAIIEETGGYVSINWIYMSEHSTSRAIHNHAKTLAVKFDLRPNNLFTYKDWPAHVARCTALDFDPKEHSEEYVIDIERRLAEMNELVKDM